MKMNCKNSAQNELKVAIFRLKGGDAPSPYLSSIGEGDTPSPNHTPSAPSASRYSRLRRSATRRLRRLDPRAFGARPCPPRLEILDPPL